MKEKQRSSPYQTLKEDQYRSVAATNIFLGIWLHDIGFITCMKDFEFLNTFFIYLTRRGSGIRITYSAKTLA